MVAPEAPTQGAADETAADADVPPPSEQQEAETVPATAAETVDPAAAVGDQVVPEVETIPDTETETKLPAAAAAVPAEDEHPKASAAEATTEAASTQTVAQEGEAPSTGATEADPAAQPAVAEDLRAEQESVQPATELLDTSEAAPTDEQPHPEPEPEAEAEHPADAVDELASELKTKTTLAEPVFVGETVESQDALLADTEAEELAPTAEEEAADVEEEEVQKRREAVVLDPSTVQAVLNGDHPAVPEAAEDPVQLEPEVSVGENGDAAHLDGSVQEQGEDAVLFDAADEHAAAEAALEGKRDTHNEHKDTLNLAASDSIGSIPSEADTSVNSSNNLTSSTTANNTSAEVKKERRKTLQEILDEANAAMLDADEEDQEEVGGEGHDGAEKAGHGGAVGTETGHHADSSIASAADTTGEW